MASTKYIVQVGSFGYLVKDEDGQKHPQFALKGSELTADELGEAQVKRGIELGAIAKASDVKSTDDGILRTEVAETDRVIDESLPIGQSDPATLALQPVQPVLDPTLSAEQISSMSVRELAGFVETNPLQRDSIIEIEKKGKNRAGVLALAELPGQSYDVVEGQALAAPPSQSRSSDEAVPDSNK